ncbi:RNA binding protein, plastid or PPC targeted [Guillardia theta CCMP2712]|uniref:RNA binding protein, plastid or PPC targeted n=1 Tax=Guillardia theta (strain CCMP2712) TaxID=905079 RepID=L1IGE7_GUITC|nr:RNA binding protein, plastid or PPC targeted [Guillardia theta CCMP2712]EKX35321.1 RNA binding protein, plastid or PPC targeted [Guillardia theta CCMP2712]|eukprot:XP_005822301.1 RNA binding protein, plastid or PPC targeted [Guillardia theta CCMP2712]
MIFQLLAALAIVSPCSAYLFPSLAPHSYSSLLPRVNSQLCPFPRTSSAVFGLNRHVRAEQRSFGAASALNMVTISDLDEEYEIDYRQADLTGQRLFVTGLPSSMDDLRLYLAFEGFGTILEAHVAKPGLGFVVFEDPETADDALDAMANTEISGKEVRVKRARSFYIKKEEEARLKMAKMAKDREMKMKMIAMEQNERARMLEEEHYIDSHLSSQRPLSAHMRDFDPRFKKRAIIQEMHDEGMLSNVYENITFVRRTTEAALASVAQGKAAMGHSAMGQERRWVHNNLISPIIIIIIGVPFILIFVISFTPYDRAPTSSLSLSHD